MKYKWYKTESKNPYHNLALENYLFDFVGNDEVILYIWQNDNTIVIGKNQILENECKYTEFRNSGGNIARRMSGGGAVYHDLGNLNYSLICKSKDKDKVIFYEKVSNALSLLGINTAFNGRNDILVDGKKFSGNAFYDNGSVYCQHGTLMVNCDITKMSYYLTPDGEKLKRNGVKSVSSRVINLSEINKSLCIEYVEKALVKATNAVPFLAKLDEEEIKKRQNVFSDYSWIYGGQE